MSSFVGCTPSLAALTAKAARMSSDKSPAKTSQLISMLLSGAWAAATGLFGFASESINPQRHRTFQCSMPVRRFSVTRVSRECWDTLTRSTGGFMIPEIAGFDDGAVLLFVEVESVTAANMRFEPGEAGLVHFLIGGQ